MVVYLSPKLYKETITNLFCRSYDSYFHQNSVQMLEVYTVEPRNNSLTFKGSPAIKVNVLRSQMVVFNVISPLFKGYPEIPRVQS